MLLLGFGASGFRGSGLRAGLSGGSSGCFFGPRLRKVRRMKGLGVIGLQGLGSPGALF